MPNIPVDGIRVRLRLGAHRVQSVAQLPGQRFLLLGRRGNLVTFTVPRLETLAMFAVKLG
jgi:hypothetical protein